MINEESLSWTIKGIDNSQIAGSIVIYPGNPLKLKKNSPVVVGLVPAGGSGARLSPLPCSKELYPVGFRSVDASGALRPKVVCHYLLERMRLAAVTNVYMVIRDGKWDIPGYLKDGKMLNMHLAYMVIDVSFGAPYTLNQAYPFIQDAVVAFGFPDIIFQPDDAFVRLLARLSASNADIVLGLFNASRPHTVDMVDQEPDGRIRGIQIKPTHTDLRYTWLIAVWTPTFTRYMHDYVIMDHKRRDANKPGQTILNKCELFVGDVIQSAIEHDMRVDSVTFDKGEYLDIGTPEDIVKIAQFQL